jgi:glycosyltransferase involved in cell wall biosynthesis
MTRPRRLISVAHSYVVALNRRLAHEMVRAGQGAWEVTAVTPTWFHGGNDLRPVPLEGNGPEPCRLAPVRARLTSRVHCFVYGRELRTLLRGGWDLVHCWEEPYVLAGGQVHWWTPRDVPVVFWTAQNLAKRYPPPFNLVERYCLARCAGWMACGQSIVETLLPRGYGSKPHRIVPLGVDTDRFRPDPGRRAAVRRSLGWEEGGPPVVGYLGRFVPEKGVEFLTRALDRLATPWRALFVGAGPLEGALWSWAARQGDRARVCTGVVHDDVPSYLNAMDLLCAPSRTTPGWREQFGRMLVEAFASGVPVIGSDSGEIPHVIGGAGLVVGEADEAGWREALGRLLDSPARRQELGRSGRERARAHYAWPVIARRHLDFFDEILERSPCRAAADALHPAG